MLIPDDTPYVIQNSEYLSSVSPFVAHVRTLLWDQNRNQLLLVCLQVGVNLFWTHNTFFVS